MKGTYYNEIDRFAAAWLRELIARDLIAPGDVDERPIQDVSPDDLAPYRQCHFFAGIGTWSYALRLAEWPDDRAVWTGSCPCQPFSAAGKRKSHEDERHLWPVWFNLIRECRPDIIFGEQVASRDGLAWLDAVQSDLESADYAIGSVDIPACGFGAPHIRQRLYFVGQSENDNWRSGERRTQTGIGENEERWRRPPISGPTGELGNSFLKSSGNLLRSGRNENYSETISGTVSYSRKTERPGPTGIVADAGYGNRTARLSGSQHESVSPIKQGYPSHGPTNGFWADAEWIWCRDGKWRPTGPGISPLVVADADGTKPRRRKLRLHPQSGDGNGIETGSQFPQNESRATEPSAFPLAYGAAARLGRLRGYGNAIVAPQAAAFVRAYLDADIQPRD